MPSTTGYDVVTLESSGVADVAFSPDQTLLYASKTDGDIDVFNVATHQKIATWHIGTDLGAISISPDGSTLIAVERQSSPGLATIYQVNTGTGIATSHSISGSNFNDVQFTDGNTVLLSAGGQSTITSFSPNNGSFSSVSGGVYYSPWDSFVKDGTYTLVSEEGVSNGPLFMYDNATHSIVASTNGFDIPNSYYSGYNFGNNAISVSAGRVFQFINSGIINVYDLRLNYISTFQSTPTKIDGIIFDSSGSHFYLYRSESGTVEKYDASTFTLVDQYSVASYPWNEANARYGDQLLIDNSSQHMTVLTADTGELQLIDLMNHAPAISSPTNAAVSYTENQSAIAVLQGVNVTDADTPANFSGGLLTLVATGAADGAITLISGNGFTVSGSTLDYNGTAIGTINGLGTDSVSVSNLTTNATTVVVNALASAFVFAVPGDNPNSADRTLTLTFDDGGNTGQGGGLSASTTQTVHVVAVNDPPVASVPGAQSGTQETNLVFSSAHGNAITIADPDAGSGNETVTLTAGNGTLTLPNEANVTVAGDGTTAVQITGTIANINAVLNGLTYKGDLDYFGSDTLTVNVNDNGNVGSGGALSDQKTIGITLASTGIFHGDAAHNHLSGTTSNDFFTLAPGSTYTLSGLAGNDVFYYGAALTAADSNDGGGGSDIVALQGNYASLTLGTHSLDNIETLSLITHTDSRFGGDSVSPYSYDITTLDANVTAGKTLIVNAATLQAGENFTFNGSAETDGSFFIYAGAGTDHLTGGGGTDIFFFAEGRYNAGDTVNGGGGNDIVVLRGDYAGANAVHFAANAFSNVETLTLMSASDTRYFSGGARYSYDITTDDANVAAGHTMTFNGGGLQSGETLHFNGSAETDGNFRIFGGADSDTITGGAGNDLIYGGLGADTLTGGAGHDTFQYKAVAESTPTSHDTITDFASGDIIDLSSIDADTTKAGDQAFTFIGAKAFDGHAGELQAINNGSGNWTISADVNGDGVADFQINVHVTDGHTIAAADFHL